MGVQDYSYGKDKFLPQEKLFELRDKCNSIKIGIPKELDKYENRIALTPLNVEYLVSEGNEIIVEKGAGNRAHFSDLEFAEAGATIVPNPEIVFQTEIILKIAPLTLDEISKLKGNQTIISTVNLASCTKDYFERLIAKKVTAVGFEYLQDEKKSFPVVRSMSEIVGSTSILIAAEYLSNEGGGKGKMLGGIAGVNPTEIVVLGAGTAAEYAVRTALGLGSQVKVFDDSVYKLRRLQNNLKQRIYTSILQPSILSKAISSADVIIGAKKFRNKNQSFIISSEMIELMKKGSVIIDISIDQGGCVESSEITNFDNPIVIKNGIIHYGIPNIASRVSRTASYALSNIFTPLLQKVAESGGVFHHLKFDYGLRKGVYIFKGILTNQEISSKHQLPAKDIEFLFISL